MTTTLLDRPAPSAGSPEHSGRRWWALAVLGLAQLMVVLDVTIVNIALPVAQHSLGFSNNDRQWVITAYALAFGSLLLLGGRLSDLFGRRNTFMIGLAGFAAMSAVGGAAGSFGMLVVARAGQGVFAALLAPAALSLLAVTFTEARDRAKAFGIFGAIAGGGGALGLLLGGMLTEWASWRWCLFVNLGFAAIALIGAFFLLERGRSEHRPRLDLPGTMTVSLALFGIVYGFSHAATNGWSNAVTLVTLAVGVALLGVFAYLQSRVAHPLLPLRIVVDRTRGGAFLAVFIVGIGMFAVFLFLTYYLQTILGYTPIVTGVAFLPMVAAMILAATTTTAVVLPRTGPRRLVTTGLLIATGGMLLLTQIDLQSTYAAHILPGLLLLGFGLGAVMAPSMQGAISGVHEGDSGVASATVNTMQQIGGSIGTALLSTIAATAMSGFLTGKPHTPVTAALAAVHSYTTTFWWVAGIFAVGAVISAVLLRPGLLPETPEGAPALAV